MNIADLHKPFPANEIEWRVGSTNADKTRGLALAYLTARHVMERLDEVCGPENWQDRYEFHGSRTVCYLSIKIGDEWVTKADGAGDSDVEAEKGAISDALKRAAVKWGIGRYLYSLASPWVELEPAGRSYRIKPTEYAKLERLMAGATMPEEPPQPSLVFQSHAASIRGSETLADLKSAFDAAKADKSLTTSEVKQLIALKDERKDRLKAPAPKTLGEHLDRLQAEDATN
jgi:hypothetical protein